MTWNRVATRTLCWTLCYSIVLVAAALAVVPHLVAPEIADAQVVAYFQVVHLGLIVGLVHRSLRVGLITFVACGLITFGSGVLATYARAGGWL
jgi:hypothetical protein